MGISLAALNAMEQPAFIDTLGGVFEHSPWVAERVWGQRPFASREALHAAMVTAVQQAGRELQLMLIRAHPELAGKAAEQGALTRESTAEQASAGLNQCTPEELSEIRGLNQAYREKFGFPFIMAVKGRSKSEILQRFRTRLANPPAQELQVCLDEIAKIAQLRLVDLIED